MAEICAFRGWRYNLARVGELSDAIAPPYDVVGPELQRSLYDRHPANAIRLELNRPQPGDDESNSVYTRAAKLLRDWQGDGTLVQDPDPALYVYHQIFDAAGRTHTRRGIIARLRLEPFGQGSVFPHEETMPGPKADRLRLMHATGMNLSSVFGLYPDEGLEVQGALEAAIRGRTPLEATDHLGVTSRLWPVNHHAVVSRVQGLLGPRPVFIADGHHRYETAVRYRDEKRDAGEVRDAQHPANFVLMTLVSMSDPGLLVLPTHRLIGGLGAVRTDQLRAALTPDFSIEEVGTGTAAAREAWALIEADGGQNAIGLGAVADGGWVLAKLRDADTVRRRVPQHSDAWCSLGVSILHEAILANLCRAQRDAQIQLKYVHLVDEVVQAFDQRSCDLACLVPAATVDHVRQIASTGERMPAKSTYFYPKLVTGMVFNSLNG